MSDTGPAGCQTPVTITGHARQRGHNCRRMTDVVTPDAAAPFAGPVGGPVCWARLLVALAGRVALSGPVGDRACWSRLLARLNPECCAEEPEPCIPCAKTLRHCPSFGAISPCCTGPGPCPVHPRHLTAASARRRQDRTDRALTMSPAADRQGPSSCRRGKHTGPSAQVMGRKPRPLWPRRGKDWRGAARPRVQNRRARMIATILNLCRGISLNRVLTISTMSKRNDRRA